MGRQMETWTWTCCLVQFSSACLYFSELLSEVLSHYFLEYLTYFLFTRWIVCCLDSSLRCKLQAQCADLAAKVFILNTPGSHMGTGPNISSPSCHPVPCLWPGKEVKDVPKPWNSAPTWETWRRFLAADFRAAQRRPLQSLGEWIIRWGRSSSLYIWLCNKKINKALKIRCKFTLSGIMSFWISF